MIKLICNRCGANLDTDIENLMAYCPYCGNKLMMDVSEIKDLLIEKEKTKREEIEAANESEKRSHEIELKKMQNKEDKKAIIVFVFLLLVVLPLFVLIFSCMVDFVFR